MPPNEPATPGTDRLFTVEGLPFLHLPGRDECAACGAGEHMDDDAYRDIDGIGTPPYSLCHRCANTGSRTCDRMILGRCLRKSAPTPAFVPAVGEMCEGLRYNGSGEVVGFPVNGPVLCGDCGKPIENMLDAYSRSRYNEETGRKEWIPGSFHGHGQCPRETPEPGQTITTPFIRPKLAEPGQSPPDPYAGYDLNAYGVVRAKEPGARDTTGPYRPKGGLSEEWIAAYMSGANESYLKSDRSLRAREDRQATEREAGAKHPSDWGVDDVEELTVS